MPAIMTLQGPNLALLGLRPVACDPQSIDPEQLRIGTLVEMEHTQDPAQARQIALHHLCETFPRPYYIQGTGTRGERLLLSGLAGPVDVIRAHPFMLIAGLLIGAHLASKNWYPKDTFSAVWGEQRARQARDRAMHGPKRRRRR